MKILITDSTDIFGGGEDYVLTLALSLRDRGHTSLVSTLPGHLLSAKCTARGIATIPIDYTGMRRVFAVAMKLRRALIDNEIDIVHSNANYDRTCAGIASAFSSVRHVATVHSAHSIQHNLTHWLRNRFWTDHFIAVAAPVKRVLIEEDDIPEQKIAFIPNGVPDNTRGSSNLRKAIRANLGIADDTIVIGNVARLVPFKGHKFLLQTVEKVKARFPSALFLVIGDGELEEELKETVRVKKIDQNIRFLGFKDHVRQYYHAFDVYCHSSIELAEEAFPIAILDALASGLPVASTDVGGIGMMVENGTTGFLTKPEQPGELADAICSLVASPNMRNQMGQAGYLLFRKDFHASSMAERVEEIYNKVMNG